ncbi:Crp/Fnr family transcriptional regulator [Bradyrhizobium sp. Arg237L]|uniref:Crp/Fnr family transcriptional regulator n=1 Tax=Bradyrhizobium sp. Arg237L TaxID=3003352 RepID=UPI00249E1152|nr:Crp/Fnr family transcriptional regulator [Bradyrhizobium sp. Arg237L]MDI4234131.1 Crp/Fnr family transcriptional regulator [Bradyrhizobium sp. Arg237L]
MGHLVQNRVLASLSLRDFDHIRPHLQPVPLKERAILQESNRHIEYVHFIETGIVSLVTLATGSLLETAMVSSRGFAPMAVVLGARTSPHRSTVLVAGTALRIRADDLQRLILERPQIREHLLRYVQSLMVHGSQTALCGVRHHLEQRLASWLCLASDAISANAIPITHDHISTILGLRRAGVTEALNRFQDQGSLRKIRGVIQIRDREQLEQQTCSCYRIITDAYR